MVNSSSLKLRLAAASVALAAAGVVSTGIEMPIASASVTTASAVEVPMSVIGYDSTVAADHGYELRTSPSGTQLSVPIENSPTDFSHSLGSASSITGITVPGDCGTSWIYFQNGNTEIRTGYLIKSDHGQAFSHTWSATVSTEGMGGAIGTYEMSGLAPLNSATWQGIRKIVQPYTSKASALAGGTAVTTAGWICGSGNPTAKYPE